MNADTLRPLLVERHRGRKWILTPDVAVAAGPMVEQLFEWGASGIMLISAIEGVGEIPEVDTVWYTRTTGDSILESIRAFTRSLDEPSAELQAAVDEFDPSGDAMVINLSFSSEPQICNRISYGSPAPEWRNLEDKMIVDELWRATGVAHARSAIVAPGRAANAASRLDDGQGTVWVADNKEGWNGGGEYVRWVVTDAERSAAVEWFAKHANRVRVMPFLDGLPCSIHGFVTPTGTAVFNPVEILVFRRTDRRAFFYTGVANFWTPPTQLKGQMRRSASAVGDLLRHRHGYLGAFGIDGIATTEGFRPTELNPRTSGGHGLHSGAAGIPLGNLQRMMLAGDLEIDPPVLGAIMTDPTLARRGSAMFTLANADIEPQRAAFVVIDGVATEVDPDSPNDGTMEVGQSAFGGILTMQFDSARTPIGPSVAPRALAVVTLARHLWEVDIPNLDPAPDLTTTSGTLGSQPD